MSSGKTFRLTAKTTDKNIYVQSATLNGKPHKIIHYARRHAKRRRIGFDDGCQAIFIMGSEACRPAR